MSAFKSIKEMSVKKKLLWCILIVAILVVAVFLIIKFCFPDPDVKHAYDLAYEIGNDVETEEKIQNAFVVLASKCSEEQIEDLNKLKSLYTYLIEDYKVNENSDYPSYKFLYSLTNVQNENKLNKKFKNLDKSYENLKKSKKSLINYYDSQINGLNNLQQSLSQETMNDYFINFVKRLTNYFQSLNSVQNNFIDIINNCSIKNSYNNELTQFSININKRYLNNCINACKQKFIDGEQASLNSLPNKAVSNITKCFVLKDDAISNFYNNINSMLEFLDEINNYAWFDGWLNCYATNEENEFLNNLSSEQKEEYNSMVEIFNQYYKINLQELTVEVA